MKTIELKKLTTLLLSLGLLFTLTAQDSQIYYSNDNRPEIENLIGLVLDGEELEMSKEMLALLLDYKSIKERDDKQEKFDSVIFSEESKKNEGDDKNSIFIEVVKEDFEPEKEELLIRRGNVVNDPNIQLYPIPANDYVYINVLDDTYYTLEVFDLTGSKRMHVNMNSMNDRKLNLENLNTGTYLVKFIG